MSYTLSTLLISRGFSYVYFTEDLRVGLILHPFLFITFLTGRATFYILLIVCLSQMYTNISLEHCKLKIIHLMMDDIESGVIGAVFDDRLSTNQFNIDFIYAKIVQRCQNTNK